MRKDRSAMEPAGTVDYHSESTSSTDRARAGPPGGDIATFTISALERATGVPRSTIHYYIGEELLPRPAKTAASRSLYTERHVDLLRRITRLKQSGLSLAEIREELRDELVDAGGGGVDLAAREYDRIHSQIIGAATEEFVANGYEGTHVAKIVKRIGITPYVFYSHFASKHQLLAECFRVMVESDLQSVEAKLEKNTDLGERLLARLAANSALHTLQSEVVSLIRAGTVEPTNGVSDALVQTYAKIVEHVAADIEAMRRPGMSAGGVPAELLAYSMLGAYDNTQLRAAWDDTYDRVTLFRTHLWLYLAIRAALDGRVDIDGEVKAYEDLIRESASGEGQPPSDPRGRFAAPVI